ncbi:MAG: MerR family transcriptional regulator [Tatlockia sp.]|nr:MerR family transcriptional regulator [Tatlockia sp.]
MTQWFVKDLSKLTGISVQTLHHYDRINLLKPSLRLTNGYRVYSEKDLLQLQQIIALKFFGFELSQIKTLLTDKDKALEHLVNQAQVLERKAQSLVDASKTLKNIISDFDCDKSIPWKNIIQLIEVYRMTEQLEHSWVKEIFTPEELKEYATFEAEFKARFTPEQKTAFEESWNNLVEDVKCHLEEDPKSELGIGLGKKFMDWVNKMYGKKYAHLRTKKFEQGFGEGKGLDEVGMTPEIVAWIDQAMDAYWRDRIYGILSKVNKVSSSTALSLWTEMLDDMYGNDSPRKNEIREVALKDEKVSEEAKNWLKSIPIIK